MDNTIKAFLEADAKRTQGVWSAHDDYDPYVKTNNPWDDNGNNYICQTTYDNQSCTDRPKKYNDANFIALASTLAPAIRTMLADIEMAREALTQITNCSIQEGLEQNIIADDALSALDKYKGGV